MMPSSEESRSSTAAGDTALGQITRAEIVISVLLRCGVAASMILIACGVVLSFAHHPGWLTQPGELRALIDGQAAFPTRLAEVWTGTEAGQGRGVVLLGLLVLIATPVARVMASVVLFVIQRNRVFVAITVVVLGLLLGSFVLGKAGG